MRASRGAMTPADDKLLDLLVRGRIEDWSLDRFEAEISKLPAATLVDLVMAAIGVIAREYERRQRTN